MKGRGICFLVGTHSEAQVIGALKREAGATDMAREVGVCKRTIYAWKATYGA
jgi:hypothetical protein